MVQILVLATGFDLLGLVSVLSGRIFLSIDRNTLGTASVVLPGMLFVHQIVSAPTTECVHAVEKLSHGDGR